MTKIMIVEDEIIVAEDIERKLNRLGHAVTGKIPSGENAVLSAEKDSPDLILMDIHLSGVLDGIDAAREIHRRRDIPVVFMTSYADPETVNRAKRAGPYGYILKPVDDGQITAAVEVALYKHHTEKQLREAAERFNALMENALDVIIELDAGGRVVQASGNFLQEIGFPLETVAGASLADFIDVRDWETFQAHNLHGEGRALSRFTCRDGRRIWYESDSRRFQTVSGQQHILVIARNVTSRLEQEAEREQLIAELREALTNVQTLRGLLPICASCKKIRDDHGYWSQIEDYLRKHSELDFSHGLCPECASVFFPGYNLDDRT